MPLSPYTGPWTTQEASHLLSRATFGGTRATIAEATGLGLEATLDLLLAEAELPPPPVLSVTDGIVAAGETWVGAPYPSDAGQRSRVTGVRRINLRSHLQELRQREGISLRETLVLFWHNHFANDFFNEPLWIYRHLNLLRREATGNFRQLVKDVTVDSVMLVFLNGTRSTLRAPNENYARELLELFTIGKGPQAGPGDYTNYTEQDVVAMARSLTGWVVRGNRTDDPDAPTTPTFVASRHDPETVQLSHRFDNQTFESTGETTYARLVDLILEKRAVAEFIVRKLYRWFVYYEITEEIENTIIQPLADQFYADDYELEPVLRTLLSSQHFYDVYSQGPMLKHPMRFVHGFIRQLEVQPNNADRPVADFYNALYQRANVMGMADFRAPSVAGWPAFYQEPLYYRHWINSTTIPHRNQIADRLFANNPRLQNYGAVSFSLLGMVDSFEAPAEVWGMIDQWVTLLFARPVPESQREFLKDALLPGLPDTQWAVEYAEHRAAPNNEEIAAALETNLRRMVQLMLLMPEYQLC